MCRRAFCFCLLWLICGASSLKKSYASFLLRGRLSVTLRLGAPLRFVLRIILPLYNEEGDRFSVLVMELLRHYGDQEEVLSLLGSSLGTDSWSGSIIPRYEKQLSCVSQLMDHPREAVRVWARRTQSSLKEKIKRETNTDQERSALYR